MFGDHDYGDDPFIDFDESIDQARGAAPERDPEDEPELPRSRRSWVRRAHMAFDTDAKTLTGPPAPSKSDLELSGVFDDKAEEIIDDALVHLGGAVTGLEAKIQDMRLEDLHHLNAFLGELREAHEQQAHYQEHYPEPPPEPPPRVFSPPPPSPPSRVFRVFLERSAMVFIGMVLVSIATGIMVTLLVVVLKVCGRI